MSETYRCTHCKREVQPAWGRPGMWVCVASCYLVWFAHWFPWLVGLVLA